MTGKNRSSSVRAVKREAEEDWGKEGGVEAPYAGAGTSPTSRDQALSTGRRASHRARRFVAVGV